MFVLEEKQGDFHLGHQRITPSKQIDHRVHMIKHAMYVYMVLMLAFMINSIKDEFYTAQENPRSSLVLSS